MTHKIEETDFDAFLQKVRDYIGSGLDTEELARASITLGFPSEAFPLMPERAGGAETMTAINYEFIAFSTMLRKTAQTRLLTEGLGLQHMERYTIGPNDVEDTGATYRFEATLD